MSHYLLSVHTVEGEDRHGSMSPEDMQAFMERVHALEAEMKESGAFVYTGALQGPDAARVVRRNEGGLVTTDGPFAEAKARIGGFYIVSTDDLDAALVWAEKVVDAINAPIEVRPFRDMPEA